MNVSVIGLGKLGAPLAAVLAYKGNKTIGYDINKKYVELINQKKAPVREPKLQNLIKQTNNLSASSNLEYVINNSDISFLILPTPSMPNGFFTNKYLIKSLEEISKILKNKKKFHVINITSTVMPGSCDNEIKKVIEKFSKKKIGKDIGLCYNPEFIALGNVVNDMLYPDMILLGESDKKSGRVLASVYKKVIPSNVLIKRMSLINAEIVKISVNTFVTTKISYANMLADLCEKLKGADVDTVTDAIGMDSRIGKKYLKGGMPYGGPCFPRDNRAFSALAKKIGANSELAMATDAINDHQVIRISKKINAICKEFSIKTIGFLGLAYKPDTYFMEESPSLKIISQLRNKKLALWDPHGINEEEVQCLTSKKVTLQNSIKNTIECSDLIVIAVNDKEFKNKKTINFIQSKKNLVVLDCWNILPDLKNKKITLGRN